MELLGFSVPQSKLKMQFREQVFDSSFSKTLRHQDCTLGEKSLAKKFVFVKGIGEQITLQPSYQTLHVNARHFVVFHCQRFF